MEQEKQKIFADVLLRSMDIIMRQANIALALGPDPSISEEDKAIMFNQVNGKMGSALAKIQKAKFKYIT